MSHQAECRSCAKPLDGVPYRPGTTAMDPTTGERCRVNVHGGYVCSKTCDEKATRRALLTKPGATLARSATPKTATMNFHLNWQTL